MQVVHTGVVGRLMREHPDLAGHTIGLAQIARRTGGHHVFPGGLPAFRARNHVIEGQILARTAVLAGEGVAQIDVVAREGTR